MLLTLAGTTLATPRLYAQDQPQLDPAEQARVDRVWTRYWRDVAPFYVRQGDTFVCVPAYDRKLPSSTGLSVEDYQKQTAREVEYQDERDRTRTRTEIKPTEEAQAAVNALPSVEPGKYGHIHSGVISEIVDDQTVILRDIWLIDAEKVREEKGAATRGVWQQAGGDIERRIRDARDGRRNNGDTVADRGRDALNFVNWSYEDREALVERQKDRDFTRLNWRIIGYKTETLRKGDRWPAAQSLQLVIISVSTTEVLAVPAAKIGSGLSELDFLTCLENRSITKAQFVEIVNLARKDHGRDYLPVVFAQLEGWELAIQDKPGQGGGEVQLAE